MKKNVLPHNMKYFWVLYISLSIIVVSVLLIVFSFMRISLTENVISTTEKDVEAFSDQFLDEISLVANDVFLMKDLLKVHDTLEIDNGDTVFTDSTGRTIVESEFLVWLSMNNTYDQIRILDNNGLEVVRVNYNDGEPFIVDQADLQNKGTRYYFTESIILDDDDLYLSPLDLNVENGQIELVDGKTKPMIRVASPIFDGNNTKLGVIIVNYLAGELFTTLNRYEQPYTDGIEILNDEGYYLYSNDDKKDFGFMYDSYQDETYDKYNDFNIQSNNQGDLETIEEESFHYSSIYISETQLANAASSSTLDDMNVVMNSGGFYLIAKVDFNTVSSYISMRNVIFTIAFLLLLSLLVIVRLADESRFLKQQGIKRMKYDAMHDILTALPNRKSLTDSVSYLLRRERKFTVLFLDFDGFKAVNDKFGHDTGDDALILGAARIQSSIRQDDILARMGGDEFVVVLKDLIDKKIVARVCDDINKEFDYEFDIDGKKFKMGVSIGAFINSTSGETVDTIIDRADKSMYKVKNNGKNGYAFFEDLNN